MSNSANKDSRVSAPLLTISVVSHGNAREVEQLLSSLVEHEATDRIQLIVTDNLGNELPDLDGSKWGGLVILRNEHPEGLARNQNAAFRLARGRYFCMLNPDVVFIQGIFRPLINHLEVASGHIVAPLVVDSRGVPQDSFRDLPRPFELLRRRLQTSLPVPEVPAARQTIAPEWIAGIFLLMKSEVFGLLGGLDEKYRLYFEDVDFCTRARLQGYSLLVDTGLSIRHDARRSSRKDFQYLFWHLESAAKFFMSKNYREIRKRRKLSGRP